MNSPSTNCGEHQNGTVKASFKDVIRSGLEIIAAILVLAGAFNNIWEFTGFVSRFPPREADAMVLWEKRYQKIHDQLIRERYTNGKIGFVTSRSLEQRPLTEQDDQNWAALRYTSIPMLLIKNDLNVPYLLADFTHDTPQSRMIEGFTPIEDSGDGLILYKRNGR